LGRKECGGLALMDLPLIPQQHHGKTKNDPQNGAAYIVHIKINLEL
jgi:hypothetical protein